MNWFRLIRQLYFKDPIITKVSFINYEMKDVSKFTGTYTLDYITLTVGYNRDNIVKLNTEINNLIDLKKFLKYCNDNDIYPYLVPKSKVAYQSISIPFAIVTDEVNIAEILRLIVSDQYELLGYKLTNILDDIPDEIFQNILYSIDIFTSEKVSKYVIELPVVFRSPFDCTSTCFNNFPKHNLVPMHVVAHPDYNDLFPAANLLVISDRFYLTKGFFPISSQLLSPMIGFCFGDFPVGYLPLIRAGIEPYLNKYHDTILKIYLKFATKED